jgi:plasmid stabilization system protein ParE
MTFRVETTAAAEQDANAILDWLLSEHAGDTGRRWFTALQDATAALAEFPERCPLAPENAAYPFKYAISSMAEGRTYIASYSQLRIR